MIQIEKRRNDIYSFIKGFERQVSRITYASSSGAIELEGLKKRREILMAKISDAVNRRDEIAALRQKKISKENIQSDVESFAVTVRNEFETLKFQEKTKLIEPLMEKVIVNGKGVIMENIVPTKDRFSVLCKHYGDIFFRSNAGHG